jgi:hypothetical protein
MSPGEDELEAYWAETKRPRVYAPPGVPEPGLLWMSLFADYAKREITTLHRKPVVVNDPMSLKMAHKAEFKTEERLEIYGVGLWTARLGGELFLHNSFPKPMLLMPGYQANFEMRLEWPEGLDVRRILQLYRVL